MSALTIFPTLTDYEKIPEDQLVERILFNKQKMGKDLIILGHHYQRPKITKLSDFVGDSYGLSEKASKSDGQNIVFCGVRFMAESAAILCQPHQKVYHPDPDAGCPMADMANMAEVNQAWDQIQEWTGGKEKIIPVTYMNSTADLKAFCGEKGGIVCTSSNAEKVFKWAFENAPLWDPKKVKGGTTPEAIQASSLILWAGHCPVHMEFKVRDIVHVRKYFPDCKVVVHPECEKEVVELADASGSTDFIVKYVAGRPTKSVTFVGTEVNLVTRLQREFPDRKVFKLQRSLCLTMYQINLANLAFTLEHMDGLETVTLPDSVKANARVALDRMLAIG